jgi:hypothetical protein
MIAASAVALPIHAHSHIRDRLDFAGAGGDRVDKRRSPLAIGHTGKQAWYDLTVPAGLQQRAFLYLSMDPQSVAFLAPFLNPGSSFVNLVGQTSLPLTVPEGSRLSTLLDRNRPTFAP